MKYLYFSIYVFYKKVVKIEYWGDTPFHYCNIVLSLFETMLLFSIIDYVILLNYKGTYIAYTPLIPFLGAMIIFFINKKYYRTREKKIIKELSKKDSKTKFLIYFLSLVFLLIVIYIFYLKGSLIRENNISPASARL